MLESDGLATAKAAASEGPGWDMDYGPFLSYTISEAPLEDGGTYPNLVTKGLAIRLANGAAVLFDTELLRFAAGWEGDFLDLSQTHLVSAKGSLHVRMGAPALWATADLPGVVAGRLAWADPRDQGRGVLPRSWARYQGLYRSGNNVLIRYSLAGHVVLEMPRWMALPDGGVFIREIEVPPRDDYVRFVLCRTPDGVQSHQESGHAVAVGPDFQPGRQLLVGARADDGVSVEILVDQGHCLVQLGPVPKRSRIRLATAVVASVDANMESFGKHLDARFEDLQALCQGGEPQWPTILSEAGHVGRTKGPWAVDSLPVPERNPWNSWMRLTGLDFLPDGRAVVSTWGGDVWMVSGIDEALKRVSWKRFAAGLFEGLGLKVRDGEIFVLERHQITRLHDLNGDGEADYYENFYNEAPIGPSYHAFSFGLETDSSGRFYFTRCGHRVDPTLPLNGGLIRVASDGSGAELLATGMRAPNGLSVGPEDQVTTADNQGNWVPSSRVDWIRPGGFYGFVPHARLSSPPTDYEKPIVWLPYDWDNSSASQIWVPEGVWGPLSGHLLHLSYGKAALFHVMPDWIGDQVQGAVTRLPVSFTSGLMRGRFRSQDGHLYVVGLLGWQTRGVREGALQRVRYTGAPLHRPIAWRAESRAIQLTFSEPLDPASATDPANYAVEQWNYRWTERYGSPEYSVKEPDKEARDAVEVAEATLLEDGRTVVLGIPSLQPVMQMRIQFRLKPRQGLLMRDEIVLTINKLPGGPVP